MQAIYPHIEISSDGVARITGTTTKVVEIVQDHLIHHWDAYEIRRQHPYLELGQIHAALGFYYDHQAELDNDIAARRLCAAEIESRRTDSTVRDKLKQSGHTL